MSPSSQTPPAWSAAAQRAPGTSRYLTPVLLDSPLAFAAERPGSASVLLLPLAGGSLLQQLVGEVGRFSTGRALVVAAAGVTYDGYDRQASLRIVQGEALDRHFAACEAYDYILLIEPRCWPYGGYDFEWIVRQSRQTSGATYAIAVGSDQAGARERVERDASGHIRRVQRVYHPDSWSGAAGGTVICAVVPGRALAGVRFSSLQDLRGQLAARGLLTQDIAVLSDVADLSQPDGVLALAEQTVDALSQDALPADLEVLRPGVFVGKGCTIAPSARLIGPVVLQDGAVVGDGATVIGPAMVGAGGRIGERAVVARSVVLPAAYVAPGTALCNEIVSGERASDSTGEGRPPEHVTVRALDSCVSRQLVVADLPRQQRSRRRRVQLVVKRVLDVTLATLGLLVLSPLLVVAGILVKVTSPGPLFFIHRREGRGGREFGCIKFRTMVPDAHKRQREMYGQNQVDGPQFKIDKDPRVTRIGAILRATNMDELPQLLNVIAGQMSLVGPRPSPFRENQICVAWRRARLSVTPGITGLWQICRDRASDADFHQWIFYDLAYVKHFSLWLDAKILFWTIASLGGRRRVPLARLIHGLETQQ